MRRRPASTGWWPVEPSDTPATPVKDWRLGVAHLAGRTAIGRQLTPETPAPDGHPAGTGAGPTVPPQHWRHAH